MPQARPLLSKAEIARLQTRLAPTTSDLERCETCRLLGDWNRYRIMKTLLDAGELCVGDIANVLDISMSATSQHLRILELSGLVASQRMGQTICYTPRSEHPTLRSLQHLLR